MVVVATTSSGVSSCGSRGLAAAILLLVGAAVLGTPGARADPETVEGLFLAKKSDPATALQQGPERSLKQQENQQKQEEMWKAEQQKPFPQGRLGAAGEEGEVRHRAFGKYLKPKSAWVPKERATKERPEEVEGATKQWRKFEQLASISRSAEEAPEKYAAAAKPPPQRSTAAAIAQPNSIKHGEVIAFKPDKAGKAAKAAKADSSSDERQLWRLLAKATSSATSAEPAKARESNVGSFQPMKQLPTQPAENKPDQAPSFSAGKFKPVNDKVIPPTTTTYKTTSAETTTTVKPVETTQTQTPEIISTVEKKLEYVEHEAQPPRAGLLIGAAPAQDAAAPNGFWDGVDRRKSALGVVLGVVFVAAFVGVGVGLAAQGAMGRANARRASAARAALSGMMRSPEEEDRTPPELRAGQSAAGHAFSDGGGGRQHMMQGSKRREDGGSAGKPFFPGKLVLHEASSSSAGGGFGGIFNGGKVLKPTPAQQVTLDLVSPKYDSEEEEDDDDESDDTVYECPGLAASGQMVVSNPFYLRGGDLMHMSAEDRNTDQPKPISRSIFHHGIKGFN